MTGPLDHWNELDHHTQNQPSFAREPQPARHQGDDIATEESRR